MANPSRMPSQHASSSSATSSSNEASSSESDVSESEIDSNPATPEEQPEQNPQHEPRGPSPVKRKRTKPSGHRPKKRQRLYRTLLDGPSSPRTHSAQNEAPLTGSWVGGSFWSAEEKEKLFELLPQTGLDDLPRLARLLDSGKSELQIRAYLLCLEDAVHGYAAHGEPFMLADVSAAVEMGDACEALIGECADDLIREELVRDLEAEVEKYGPERAFDFSTPTLATTTGEGTKSGVAEEEAADLLDAETMLRLSSNVFMNCHADLSQNWRTYRDRKLDITSPILFRSAYDDLTQLVTLFARRLVRTTCFQATARLRAGSASHRVEAEVKVADVEIARELLGVRADEWRRFWAYAPRRNGVKVFSYSDKFVDGRRTTTKNGVEISFEEAEAELGFASHESEAQQRLAREAEHQRYAARERRPHETAAQSHRSESSSGSDSEYGLTLEEADAKFERDYVSTDSEDLRRGSRRSKRWPEEQASHDADSEESSPDELATKARKHRSSRHEQAVDLLEEEEEEEDRLLEQRDQRARKLEEADLIFRLLGGEAPVPEVEVVDGGGKEAKQKILTAVQRQARAELDARYEWRSRTNYVAQWEQPQRASSTEATVGELQRVKDDMGSRAQVELRGLEHEMPTSEDDADESDESDEEY